MAFKVSFGLGFRNLTYNLGLTKKRQNHPFSHIS